MLRFARNDSTPTLSLRRPKACGNLVIPGSSLRDFAEGVAISLFLACHCESCLQLVAISVVLGLSLRELLATRGNLVIFGSSLRDFAEVVAIHKKLKIEAQSAKMTSLLNHFSLLSYEVRNERSIRN